MKIGYGDIILGPETGNSYMVIGYTDDDSGIYVCTSVGGVAPEDEADRWEFGEVAWSPIDADEQARVVDE